MGVYSTTTRYTGLSGIDTESMVQAMMKVETLKYDNLKKARQKTTWKQEAYKAQVNIINSFYKSYIDILGGNSLRKSSTFAAVKSSVTLAGVDSTAAKISASSSATGTYSLSIQKLATSDSYKSSSKVTGTVEGTSDFDVSNLRAGDSINVTLNGRTVKLTFDETDLAIDSSTQQPTITNAQFVDRLNAKLETAFGVQTAYNSSGTAIGTEVKAYAELNGNKLSFKVNGNNELKVSEGGRDSSVIMAIGNLDDSYGTLNADESKNFTINVNGAEVSFRLSKEQLELANEEDRTAAYVYELNKALSGKNVQVSQDEAGKLKFAAIGTTEPVTISGGGLEAIGISSGVTIGPTSVLATQMGIANGATTTFSTTQKLSDVLGSGFVFSGEATDDKGKFATLVINGKEIKAYENETVSSFMSRVNGSGAGVKLSLDSISQTFKLEGTATGSSNSIQITDSATKDFLNIAFKLDMDAGPAVAAGDAEFTLNGEKYFRESNSVTVGGLSLTLNEATGSEVLKVEVAKDTETVMKAIKSFVEAYNALIEGLNGAVNESRAKTSTYSYYEPLTDEQRSAMSDSDIENWEKKAKQGLLNRDQTLSGITSAMRTALYKSVDLGGTKISLYEIGITTSSNVSDQGKLVIDEEKLLKAIEERGSDIGTLFTKSGEGLGDRLDKILNNAIGANGSLTKKVGSDFYASTLTNNEMYNLMKKQDDQLADLLISLRNKEESYYTKFSKMETAIMEANSQMSYLQSMLGL